jgi:hypothetical protein
MCSWIAAQGAKHHDQHDHITERAGSVAGIFQCSRCGESDENGPDSTLTAPVGISSPNAFRVFARERRKAVRRTARRDRKDSGRQGPVGVAHALGNGYIIILLWKSPLIDGWRGSGRCSFEAGRRHIDVRNVIWLGTSNIGQELIFEHHASRREPESVMTREEYVGLMASLRPQVSDRLGVRHRPSSRPELS